MHPSYMNPKRDKIRKEGDISFYKGFEDMGLNY
jgi:hypothetical protein